jgi:hypothetical protein
MNEKQAIRLIHEVLQNKDKWYLDVICPDDVDIEDIANKAKENADDGLPSLSVSALYSRYRLWRKILPPIEENKEFFDQFLSAVAFDLGRRSLRGTERDLFEDTCSISIHFL